MTPPFSFCLCTPISLSAHKETGVRLQRKVLHPHRLLPQTLPLKGDKLLPEEGIFLISTAVVQADSRFSIYQGGTTLCAPRPTPKPPRSGAAGSRSSWRKGRLARCSRRDSPAPAPYPVRCFAHWARSQATPRPTVIRHKQSAIWRQISYA